MNVIPVAEIFGPTIQGEGPDIGLKSIFIRVAGCDFKCAWCDSKFTWKIDSSVKKYTPRDLAQELYNKCIETYCESIIITGGNPCLYDFSEVIKLLHSFNIRIGVETQGSILPSWLTEVDCLVISPKAPSSNQEDVFDKVKTFIYSAPTSFITTIKIPIFTEEDFLFATRYYKEFQDLLTLKVNLYLSVGNTDVKDSSDISSRVLYDYKTLIEKTCKSDLKKVYILPQLHTLVWGNKQGV